MVGWRAVGWVGGWPSFRAWVSAFVPVGGGAVIVFGTTAVLLSPLYNRPAPAKFEYETTYVFRVRTPSCDASGVASTAAGFRPERGEIRPSG